MNFFRVRMVSSFSSTWNPVQKLHSDRLCGHSEGITAIEHRLNDTPYRFFALEIQEASSCATIMFNVINGYHNTALCDRFTDFPYASVAPQYHAPEDHLSGSAARHTYLCFSHQF